MNTVVSEQKPGTAKAPKEQRGARPPTRPVTVPKPTKPKNS